MLAPFYRSGLGRFSPSNFGHHCAWRTYGSRKRLRMSANVRPAMRPSRLAVSWGSLFLLTRPASNSANQARNLANSAGGSRRIASSITSTVMAAGIARRPQSLKNQWLANRDVTIFRRQVIEVGKQRAPTETDY